METSPLHSPFRPSSMVSDAESEEAILQVSVILAIDLRFMSQDDLNCLAALSDEFCHLRRDDVIFPKIDRSIFNESAGSWKQIYSHLRLAQRKDDASASASSDRHRMGLLTVSRHQGNSVADSEQRDNNQIICLLRELFAKDRLVVLYPSDNGFSARVFDVAERSEARSVVGVVGKVNASRPRKKDDARKEHVLSSQAVPDGRLESGGRSYSDGVRDGVVDIFPLATEDVFITELRRRTAGLASEANMVAS